MVDIPQQQEPTPEEAFLRLQTWYANQVELARLKTAEILDRKALAAFYFPDAEEGSQRRALGGGYDLKLVQGINRNVDEAALDNVKASDAKKLKLNLDDLFPTKRVLCTSAYRELTDAQRTFVDSLLDIKEGTPKLEIVAAWSEAAIRQHAAEGGEYGVPAPHRRKAKPAPEPFDGPSTAATFDIALVAEEATAGQYYGDGEGNWWQLQPDLEWLAVEDDETVAALNAVIVMDDVPPVPPAPKKARKARAKKVTQA